MPNVTKLTAKEYGSSEEITIKRGKGRPKGSKNKPKTEQSVREKKGRGRPKGSKNKPKVFEPVENGLALYTCACGNSIPTLAAAQWVKCSCGYMMKREK